LLTIRRSEDVWIAIARLKKADVILSSIAIDESLRHGSKVKLNEAINVNGQQLLHDDIHSWLSNLDDYVCLGVGSRHSNVKCEWAAIERLTDLVTITAT
jgi:hypothetical protein